MSWVRLQMISLGSLLIFNEPFSAAAAPQLRCIDTSQLRKRHSDFLRGHLSRTGISANDTRTCKQAAKEMRGDVRMRSLSPWKYSINIDMDRIPPKILFAECLCQGCIINQHEDLSYNSVSVFSQMMVLKKIPCPNDPNKYIVKKDFINVPIACTCAVPKYNK